MTTFEQFREALRDDAERSRLGIDMDPVEVEWVVEDEVVVEARYKSWISEHSSTAGASQRAISPSASGVPGRVSGFVWGLLSVVLISLVFGVAAVVLATKAGRVVHAGEPGRGLINAAYVLGYAGIAMSVICLMTLIGLWIRSH